MKIYLVDTKQKDSRKVKYAVTLLILGKLCHVNLTHSLPSYVRGKGYSKLIKSERTKTITVNSDERDLIVQLTRK